MCFYRIFPNRYIFFDRIDGYLYLLMQPFIFKTSTLLCYIIQMRIDNVVGYTLTINSTLLDFLL